MIELDCQQLLIDAVKEQGGCAIKFNNRFVIGIPDLLLKPQGLEPMILEAKLYKFSRKTLDMGHIIHEMGVTKLQRDQLRDWNYAGMLTGVASFVMEQGGDVRSLRLRLYTYQEMTQLGWSAATSAHTVLGDKSERMTNIRELLIHFARI